MPTLTVTAVVEAFSILGAFWTLKTNQQHISRDRLSVDVCCLLLFSSFYFCVCVHSDDFESALDAVSY